MANDFFDSFGETISRTARELSEKAENFYEVQKLRNQISAEERVVSKTMERLGSIIYKRYEGGEPVDDEIAGICGEISRHVSKIHELRNQISAEERVVSKTMERLGSIIYKRYEGGEPVDDEIAGICGEISRHVSKIHELKGSAAGKAMERLGSIIYKRYEGGEPVDDEIAGICGEISRHVSKIHELKGSAAGKAGQKICPSCHHTIDKEVFFCPFCGTACEDKKEKPISRHVSKIHELKGSAAGKAGQKICPSCHHTIDKEVFFCPFCGTACEDKKEKPEEEAFREETVEKTENTPEEDTSFQGTEESEGTETRETESGETEEAEELGKTEEKISGSEEV